MTPKRSLLLVAAGAVVAPALALMTAQEPTTSFIVQGDDTVELVALVESVGGEVTHELGIIHAVAANLTPQQLSRIADSSSVIRVEENRAAFTAGSRPRKKTLQNSQTTTELQPTVSEPTVSKSTLSATTEEADFSWPSGWSFYDYFPELVAAKKVHELDITGRGVTVAVLDTGVVSWWELTRDPTFQSRLAAQFDAIANQELTESWDTVDTDQNGHGTHVAAIAVSDGKDSAGKYYGLAPSANLVVVKAFGANGEGTYADVVRGIDWIVKNKDRLGVRVLNLSFSAPPRSHYWDDPVNQAVMRAWQAGIVVVASAGNTGPSAMSVGVPGNVPYVITVGAMTDNYTPTDRADDRLTTFSAAGPTAERFVKPDVVAPGGHITALMDFTSTIAAEHPEFHDSFRYFTMSGTSQSAAVVSGIVALMLERDPMLSPDGVKCRLMAGAHPAVNEDGTVAYSVFQQGAGLVNAYDAVFNSALGCANRGLDIEKDLDGVEHYAGAARKTDEGSYYIDGVDGSLWGGSTLWHDSFLWSDSMLWHDSFLWNDSFLWHDSFLWNDSMLWHDSFLWNDSTLWRDSFLWNDSVGINAWVEQQ